MTAQTLQLQRAAVSDVRAIHEMVNGFARRGEVLPRTIAEITCNEIAVVLERPA